MSKRFTITEDEMHDAMCGTDNPGICIACGERQGGCEPDARNYTCEVCGEKQVFGLEEALLEMLVDFE